MDREARALQCLLPWQQGPCEAHLLFIFKIFIMKRPLRFFYSWTGTGKVFVVSIYRFCLRSVFSLCLPLRNPSPCILEMIWAPPSFLPRSISSPTPFVITGKDMCSQPCRTLPVSWLQGPNERSVQDPRCKHPVSLAYLHPSWHIVARATHRFFSSL